jgi:hypothetical protein
MPWSEPYNNHVRNSIVPSPFHQAEDPRLRTLLHNLGNDFYQVADKIMKSDLTSCEKAPHATPTEIYGLVRHVLSRYARRLEENFDGCGYTPEIADACLLKAAQVFTYTTWDICGEGGRSATFKFLNVYGSTALVHSWRF